MVPCRLVRFRLHSATRLEASWLRDTLSDASRALGTEVMLAKDATPGLR
jgi:hypothetical protein